MISQSQRGIIFFLSLYLLVVEIGEGGGLGDLDVIYINRGVCNIPCLERNWTLRDLWRLHVGRVWSRIRFDEPAKFTNIYSPISFFYLLFHLEIACIARKFSDIIYIIERNFYPPSR